MDPAPRPFSCPCRWGRPDALSPASALAWVARKRRHKTRTRSLPFIPFFFHLLALAPCLVGSGASCCLRPAAGTLSVYNREPHYDAVFWALPGQKKCVSVPVPSSESEAALVVEENPEAFVLSADVVAFYRPIAGRSEVHIRPRAERGGVHAAVQCGGRRQGIASSSPPRHHLRRLAMRELDNTCTSMKYGYIG